MNGGADEEESFEIEMMQCSMPLADVRAINIPETILYLRLPR
jgi:hypothetical protein